MLICIQIPCCQFYVWQHFKIRIWRFHDPNLWPRRGTVSNSSWKPGGTSWEQTGALMETVLQWKSHVPGHCFILSSMSSDIPVFPLSHEYLNAFSFTIYSWIYPTPMTPVKVTINQEGALKKLNNLLLDCQWDLATPSIHNVCIYIYTYAHIYAPITDFPLEHLWKQQKPGEICPSKSSHHQGSVLSRNNNFQPKTSAWRLAAPSNCLKNAGVGGLLRYPEVGINISLALGKGNSSTSKVVSFQEFSFWRKNNQQSCWHLIGVKNSIMNHCDNL